MYDPYPELLSVIPQSRTIVEQKLFNQIHMGQDHPATAVSFTDISPLPFNPQLELVKCFASVSRSGPCSPLINLSGQQLKVALPQSSNHLATRETPDRDNLG